MRLLRRIGNGLASITERLGRLVHIARSAGKKTYFLGSLMLLLNTMEGKLK